MEQRIHIFLVEPLVVPVPLAVEDVDILELMDLVDQLLLLQILLVL